ncbi:MAG: DUF2461 domain-containing protein [Oscillibacter sp.]|nr:DUF2461 domain-containing protein [Oscillibacter sp.]
MFNGFSQAAVDFMWGIRFNNNREWFQAHKPEYLTSFYQPMTELADELLEFLSGRRPDDALIRKVTRIYRDARRLFGRGPYKDHLWFTVERPAGTEETRTGKPCFWFELTPEEWSYGLGYWMPKPVTMAKLRARIDRDPEPAERLTRRLNRSPEFTLSLEEYRRPRSEAPSKILAPWYRAKSFAITHAEPLSEELYGRAIVEHLKTGCAFLLPYYDWLQAVDADPEPDLYERKRKP